MGGNCLSAVARMNEMSGNSRSSAVLQEVVAKSTNRLRGWRTMGRSEKVRQELRWLESRLLRDPHLIPLVSMELRSALAQAQSECGGTLRSTEGLVKCQIQARLIERPETDLEAGGLFTGSAVVIGDLVIGSLDADGKIDFYVAAGEYDITIVLRGGNIGSVTRFSTNSPSVVVNLDVGKEIYLQADTIIREERLGGPAQSSKSLVVSLRDPATDEMLAITPGAFEVFFETDSSTVDVTNLVQLRGRDLVVEDVARLELELLKANVNQIVIHVESSLGRQWQSTLRLAIPLK